MTTPFRSSRRPDRPTDEKAGELDLAPATGGHGFAPALGLDLGERTVVACGFECGGDRGVEEPVGGSRRPQRVLERGREQWGDDHRLRVGAVEPLEIRFGPEAAERSVEDDEEPLDGVVFERGRAADHDLAAHRPEPVRAHDVCVDACGGLDDCEGATEPD